MKLEIAWNKLLIEAAVIVGSILLAFAIDAWWEEWTDRREEQQQLSRLHNEFLSSTERMGGPDNFEATIAIYDLLEAHKDSSLPLAIPTSLIVQMLATPTFDRATPVLDGLIQSGNLSLIQNEAVLSSISIWQRDIVQLAEQEQDARRVTYEILIPALSERGNMGEALIVYPPLLRSNPVDGESLLQVDNKIIGLVADRARHITGTLRGLGNLRESTQGVIDAIENADEF